MKKKQWTFLKPGDSVDLIAPGFLSTDKEIQGAIDYIKSWGLVPRVLKHVSGNHFLHSNTDENRYEDLREALYESKSKVIWCLRGGYGSNRLLPWLKKEKNAPKRVKLLIGISDISSLHLHLNQAWGWPSLHASLLDRLGQGKVSTSTQLQLKDLLFGKKTYVEYNTLKPLNSAAKNYKKEQGMIVGGNLTVLQSTLGTPFQIDLKTKFLFIEDLGERGYRIDRILEHFKQAGAFKKCLGLLVGEFTGGREPDSDQSKVQQAIERFAHENSLPVWSGLPMGHGDHQEPLFFHTPAEFRRVRKGNLFIHQLKILSQGKSEGT